METSRRLIEIGAAAIEAMAVLVIAGAFLWASVRFLVHMRQQDSNRYETYKLSLGRSLSLGLEFLVAADVIRTVTSGAYVYQYRSFGRSYFDPDLLELVSGGRDGRPLAVAAEARYRPRSDGLRGER